MLFAIGALDADGRITPEGRRIRALPIPPRLARMVIAAAGIGVTAARDAADLAALLVERGLGGSAVELGHRLDLFRRDRGGRAEDMRRLAAGWAAGAGAKPGGEHLSPGRLLALAFPDRLAIARGGTGQFLLANGRAGGVDATDPLARARHIVVAEMTGAAQSSRITAAAPLSDDDFAAVADGRVTTSEELTFDMDALALRARRLRRLDAITLASDTMPVPATEGAAVVLAEGVARAGLRHLPWTKALSQWRDRVMFLRAAADEGEGGRWPDLSDAALSTTAGRWLAPFVNGRAAVRDIQPDELSEALRALLPWELGLRLDAEAPTHFEAPTGSNVAVDYEAEGGPTIAIRVQELFGLKTHPSVAGGRVPLVLHLLSPAHRPIQITKDLPGFWAGSWSAVKTEMKGRYPRHVWPDDPAATAPTTRAKPRGT
jgi:ATP-dependent helicase HrpB